MSIICPICGSTVKSVPLKEWTYAVYVVNRFRCDDCENNFNIYFDDERESFTVPKRTS